MSGGSYNYLCYRPIEKLLDESTIDDMEIMEQRLIKMGYTDIARDVRRLIEYCRSANIRIGVLFEALEDVFHDIEWYDSADIGEERLVKTLERYRNGESEDIQC